VPSAAALGSTSFQSDRNHKYVKGILLSIQTYPRLVTTRAAARQRGALQTSIRCHQDTPSIVTSACRAMHSFGSEHVRNLTYFGSWMLFQDKFGYWEVFRLILTATLLILV